MFINILIVNWNSCQQVGRLLRSIKNQTHMELRVFLVDNRSDDADYAQLKNLTKDNSDLELHLTRSGYNLGYAGGNNLAFKILQEKKFSGNLLIVNPDVELAPNTVYEMHKAMTDEVGAVMVRTRDPAGSVSYDYIKMEGLKQYYFSTNRDVIESDYAAGSCLMLRRELIDQIGLFDESFFMYWEEVDLAYRIKEMGYAIVSTTKAEIMREKNNIDRSPLAIYYSIRNAKTILRRWHQDGVWANRRYFCNLLLCSIKISLKQGSFRPLIYSCAALLSKPPRSL